jgi:hypothetical protein
MSSREGSRHRLRWRASATPRAAVQAGAKRSRQAAWTEEGRVAWQPADGLGAGGPPLRGHLTPARGAIPGVHR